VSAADERPILAEAVVPEGVTARMDAWSAAALPQWLPSRNRARKAVKSGLLVLDGEPVESSRWLAAGQRVTLYRGPEPTGEPLQLALEIVYEDDQLAVVVKPAGLLTNGNRFATLERALPLALKPSLAPDALSWPSPVHRLDRPTTGLVVCAKTHTAQVWLGQALESRHVHKRYRALLMGRLDGEHEVHEPIDGREAHSTIVPVAHSRSLKTDWITTVELRPHTGRTHQLRRHCAFVGHPVLGDMLYSPGGRTLRSKGLFLQAIGVRLQTPDGVVHDWAMDELPKFEAQRARDDRRWVRWYAEHPLG
jgi:tRNA pseudouridine65 synthase/23S rRNA pseudouridine1911/1915/1917 synthase